MWAWPRSRGEVRGRGEARWTNCSNISCDDTDSLRLLVTGPASVSLLIDSVSEFLRMGDNKLSPADKSETIGWW